MESVSNSATVCIYLLFIIISIICAHVWRPPYQDLIRGIFFDQLLAVGRVFRGLQLPASPRILFHLLAFLMIFLYNVFTHVR